MIKLRYLYVFFLITSLFFNYSTHSMESSPLKSHPLNWRDRQIFLYEIKRVGVEAIKEQLGLSHGTKELHKTHNFQYHHCLIIVELKLYPNHKGDVLTKMIYEAIEMKENDKNYIQDNFLSDYTQYWHEEDDKKNDYIRCKSIFTEKKELEDILIQFENAFKKQNKKSLNTLKYTIK